MTCYDRETGRMMMVEESVLRSVEEGDQEALAGLPKWQEEQVAIAWAKDNLVPYQDDSRAG